MDSKEFTMKIHGNYVVDVIRNSTGAVIITSESDVRDVAIRGARESLASALPNGFSGMDYYLDDKTKES